MNLILEGSSYKIRIGFFSYKDKVVLDFLLLITNCVKFLDPLICLENKNSVLLGLRLVLLTAMQPFVFALKIFRYFG